MSEAIRRIKTHKESRQLSFSDKLLCIPQVRKTAEVSQALLAGYSQSYSIKHTRSRMYVDGLADLHSCSLVAKIVLCVVSGRKFRYKVIIHFSIALTLAERPCFPFRTIWHYVLSCDALHCVPRRKCRGRGVSDNRIERKQAWTHLFSQRSWSFCSLQVISIHLVPKVPQSAVMRCLENDQHNEGHLHMQVAQWRRACSPMKTLLISRSLVRADSYIQSSIQVAVGSAQTNACFHSPFARM